MMPLGQVAASMDVPSNPWRHNRLTNGSIVAPVFRFSEDAMSEFVKAYFMRDSAFI